MVSVILPNAEVGHTPPDPPYKENGDLYPLFMTYENNRYLVYADTHEELLEYLIPGYIEKEEDEKILSRISLALAVQTQAQAILIANLEEADRDKLQRWEWGVLTHQMSSSPSDWSSFAGEAVEQSSGESIDIWYSTVPLVLVDTGYAPFTDTPRPVSSLGASRFEANLYWLEPSAEEAFLESLMRVNYIYLAQRLADD